MEIEKFRKLGALQVKAFDTDYVEGHRWIVIRNLLERDFPAGNFRFLDVGGGNGRFADRLLAEFPSARGAVLDNSEALLALNTTNDRKTIINDSVENLDSIADRFDVIFVHWLLHHLVGSSYELTKHNQLATLQTLRKMLAAGGRISVFENMYRGWLWEELPGWLIYQLTSAKAIAAMVRRMGANTAGVGVCFRSKNEWRATIENAGFQIAAYTEPDNWIWPLRPIWRVVLHIRQVQVAHFWLVACP
jgi:SAM-dependent methyltransferase